MALESPSSYCCSRSSGSSPPIKQKNLKCHWCNNEQTFFSHTPRFVQQLFTYGQFTARSNYKIALQQRRLKFMNVLCTDAYHHRWMALLPSFTFIVWCSRSSFKTPTLSNALIGSKTPTSFCRPRISKWNLCWLLLLTSERSPLIRGSWNNSFF